MRAPTDTVPARVREPIKPAGGREPVRWTHRRLRSHLPALAVIVVGGGWSPRSTWASTGSSATTCRSAGTRRDTWTRRTSSPRTASGGVPHQLPRRSRRCPAAEPSHSLTLSCRLFACRRSPRPPSCRRPRRPRSRWRRGARDLHAPPGVWSAAAVTLLVGTSAVVIRLMAPETYTDNLVAAAIFVAALVPLVSARAAAPGSWPRACCWRAGIAHSRSSRAASVLLAALALAPRSGARGGAGTSASLHAAGRLAATAGRRRGGRRRDLRRPPRRSGHAQAHARRADEEASRGRAALPVLAHAPAGRAGRRRRRAWRRPGRRPVDGAQSLRGPVPADRRRRVDAPHPAQRVAAYLAGKAIAAHRLLGFCLPLQQYVGPMVLRAVFSASAYC